MRQGFRPATINVLAHSLVPRIRCRTPEPEEGRARSFFRGSRPDGPVTAPVCEAGGAPVPVGVAGPGTAAPGEEPLAAAEEDQWRPVPGHLAVDRGADDDQVITAVGQPDGPAIQLLVRGQDARADVPGPGEYAEPGRAALQAPG